MNKALRALARTALLAALFVLATYLALTIQTYVSSLITFNKTLGLESPLIIGGYGLYLNLTAVIIDAVLVTIAYLVLARGEPRSGLTRYLLSIIVVYTLIAVALYLAVTANPAHACTSMPMNLDSIATFTVTVR
jgi:hypothetical protein